ncbi:MAG: DUF2341 domain-containing protein, partial [bacterium]
MLALKKIKTKSSGAGQIKYLLLVGLSLFCLSGLFLVVKNELLPKSAQAWWDSGWGNRMQLFFNNIDQGQLDYFPVLVHLTSEHFNFSETQAEGQDIRFIDADDPYGESAELNYEIELWDLDNQEAYIWVQVPKINGNSSDDYIWMYWGNDDPSLEDGQQAAATWSNGYEQVLHFKEKLGDWASDSTNNLNRAFLDDNEDNGWLEDGKIGWGYDFDGVDDLASVTDDLNHSLDITDQITIEAWLDPTGYQKEEGEITRVKDSLEIESSNASINYPDIIRASGDIYVAAYSKYVAGYNGNGWLKTFTIDDLGNITAKSSLNYETAYAYHPDLIHVGG